jgi:hypothetical protein
MSKALAMWNTELQAQPGLGGEQLATGTKKRHKAHSIKAAIQQKNQDPGSDNDAIPDEAPPPHPHCTLGLTANKRNEPTDIIHQIRHLCCTSSRAH